MSDGKWNAEEKGSKFKKKQMECTKTSIVWKLLA